MNWSPEPVEIDRPWRAQIRGKRYTMVPLEHASISTFGYMFPINLQTSLSKHWPRPIVAATAERVGELATLNGFVSDWWWIHWQSAGEPWRRCAL